MPLDSEGFGELGRAVERKADRHMQVEKGMWLRPELTALVRSRPEEAVLAACKIVASDPAPGPANNKTCETQPAGPCLVAVGS